MWSFLFPSRLIRQRLTGRAGARCCESKLLGVKTIRHGENGQLRASDLEIQTDGGERLRLVVGAKLTSADLGARIQVVSFDQGQNNPAFWRVALLGVTHAEVTVLHELLTPGELRHDLRAFFSGGLNLELLILLRTLLSVGLLGWSLLSLTQGSSTLGDYVLHSVAFISSFETLLLASQAAQIRRRVNLEMRRIHQQAHLLATRVGGGGALPAGW